MSNQLPAQPLASQGNWRTKPVGFDSENGAFHLLENDLRSVPDEQASHSGSADRSHHGQVHVMVFRKSGQHVARCSFDEMGFTFKGTKVETPHQFIQFLAVSLAGVIQPSPVQFPG